MTPGNLWALLWGDAEYCHKIRLTYDGQHGESWVPCGNRRAFERLLVADDVHVSCVPRVKGDDFALGLAHVLWVRLESSESCQRLMRFRVPPTLVVREGSSQRRVALWALSVPLDATWAIKAGERLAYALKGRRSNADPSLATFPSPFTRITLGRSKPCKVYTEFESDTHVTPRTLVGGLADAPTLRDWRTERDAA
jgi:hypothetical protein